MIIEEEFVRFTGVNANDIFKLAKSVGLTGICIVEYDQFPYIEFDEETTNGCTLMDMNQYLLIITDENNDAVVFVLDESEFKKRQTPKVVLEFERILNILLPTLSDSANIYQIIGEIMGIGIYGIGMQKVSIDGYECSYKLDLDKFTPLNYSVEVLPE